MATRLLIDATHPEETRVVVVSGTRLEEFDCESAARKQLKGNIYLAKVTRVEPSLQAAFVDYGGNRHGFLAFGDIHPDYYQIPFEDRQALLEERAAENAERGMREFGGDEGPAQRAEPSTSDAPAESQAEAAGDDRAAPLPETIGGDSGDSGESGESEPNERREARVRNEPAQPDGAHSDGHEPLEQPETVGGDETESYVPRRHSRRYKIQEVIKRRQVLLVQVVKEERGSKGAALTTYLSLAGRYCVLMPNTARGGGVSRKITTTTDRKRLREIIDGLEVPDGMGLIVRTAGQQRTKADIRRDYEYLLRMWDNVRELTLQSTAPALVYEEASLIKRSIRDLYRSDVDAVLVEGEEGYKQAKSIMRMLMPSHAKRVQRYEERIPLFHRYQVEQQLDLMHSPRVQLRSGGYIILNSTEALVAIDVNSGRSTRERNIEETAVKTNLEAAEEVSRQLRLRDLAGLIVIDFIDMEEGRNNRAVERRLKECLKGDRARIQVGRISAFGLLELSRQRLRPSLLETSTETCPTCGGSGLIRSTESAALHVLRAIEDDGIKGSALLTVEAPPKVAIYLLNQKRNTLADLERRFGLLVTILPDSALIPPAHRIAREARAIPVEVPQPRPDLLGPLVLPESEEEDEDEEEEKDAGLEENLPEDEQPAQGEAGVASESAPRSDAPREGAGDAGDDRGGKRRRRGKRGGRRRSRREDGSAEGPQSVVATPQGTAREDAPRAEDGGKDDRLGTGEPSVPPMNGSEASPQGGAPGEPATGRRRRRRRSRRRSGDGPAGIGAPQHSYAFGGTPSDLSAAPPTSAPTERPTVAEPIDLPYRPREQERSPDRATPVEVAPMPQPPKPAPTISAAGPAPAPTPAVAATEDENTPRRKGWWNFGRG